MPAKGKKMTEEQLKQRAATRKANAKAKTGANTGSKKTPVTNPGKGKKRVIEPAAEAKANAPPPKDIKSPNIDDTLEDLKRTQEKMGAAPKAGAKSSKKGKRAARTQEEIDEEMRIKGGDQLRLSIANLPIDERNLATVITEAIGGIGAAVSPAIGAAAQAMIEGGGIGQGLGMGLETAGVLMQAINEGRAEGMTPDEMRDDINRALADGEGFEGGTFAEGETLGETEGAPSTSEFTSTEASSMISNMDNLLMPETESDISTFTDSASASAVAISTRQPQAPQSQASSVFSGISIPGREKLDLVIGGGVPGTLGSEIMRRKAKILQMHVDEAMNWRDNYLANQIEANHQAMKKGKGKKNIKRKPSLRESMFNLIGSYVLMAANKGVNIFVDDKARARAATIATTAGIGALKSYFGGRDMDAFTAGLIGGFAAPHYTENSIYRAAAPAVSTGLYTLLRDYAPNAAKGTLEFLVNVLSMSSSDFEKTFKQFENEYIEAQSINRPPADPTYDIKSVPFYLQRPSIYEPSTVGTNNENVKTLTNPAPLISGKNFPISLSRPPIGTPAAIPPPGISRQIAEKTQDKPGAPALGTAPPINYNHTPSGKQGERGMTGLQGEPGERGFKGDQGERGFKGDQGERGFKGDKGDKGDRGQQGEEGPPGYDGTNHEKENNERYEEFLRRLRFMAHEYDRRYKAEQAQRMQAERLLKEMREDAQSINMNFKAAEQVLVNSMLNFLMTKNPMEKEKAKKMFSALHYREYLDRVNRNRMQNRSAIPKFSSGVVTDSQYF